MSTVPETNNPLIQSDTYKKIEQGYKQFKARKYAHSRGVPTYLTFRGDKLFTKFAWGCLAFGLYKTACVLNLMTKQPFAETPHPSEK